MRKELLSHKTSLKKVKENDVGGKAKNLFLLLRYGFPVPPYCVVTRMVFDKVMDAQKKAIQDIVNSIDFTSRRNVEKASLRIKDLILSTGFPKYISINLFKTIDKIFGKDVLLSVRSSVIGEDSTEHSFAGQMDSYLNVKREGVVRTIRKVWASAFSSRALAYRKQRGIELNNISSAVILQSMVQSQSSGIIFTKDPEQREPECIISAGFGLGEGIVTNSVEADTYRIKWPTNEISKEVRQKDFRVVLNALDGSGNQKESVPDEIQREQVLTDTQIHRLVAVAKKAEKHFGIPQDIEWAFNTKGRLFILQARPIVGVTGNDTSDSFRIWDNSNIIESYPGLTLPLTFSFVRSGYESTLRKAAQGIVFYKKEVSKKKDIFKTMVALLDGRVYYNLLNWYEMLSYLPGFKRHKKSWDQMIGISQKIDFPQNQLSPLNRFLSSLLVLWRLLTVDRTAKKFFRYFKTSYSKFKDIDTTDATEHDLIAIYDELDRALRDKWYLTIHNDFYAMKYFDWLKKLCTQWGLAEYPNLHNNLLCGEGGIESVAPVRSLIRLAEKLRKKPLYQQLFTEEDSDIIWEKIQNDPAYSEIKSLIDSHLHTFGDRGVEELKLENPTFREEPITLIGLLKNYHCLGLSIESMEHKELKVRRDAESHVKNHLKNPLKRLLFWWVMRNARKAIANRENMRFARTRLFGIFRRLFRRMAILFVEKGLLETTSDIFYLTVDEVFGFVQGTTVTQNLKAVASLRKSEYTEFSRRNLAERLETSGIPYLSSLSGNESKNGLTKILKGISCSSGRAEGLAKVVFDPRSSDGNGDYILVAKSTDPGWVFLMISSKGIVVERGSVLSHTAIIGRELGIPTIVGVKDATKIIPDGARMTMNGSTGEIRWQ